MVETERSMWQNLAACGMERPEDRRRNWIASGLILLWALTYLGATLLLKRQWVAAGAPTYLVAAVPIAVSVAAVAAYVRFLTRADELLRKMTLEALAVGFGAGFVATFALDLAEKAGFGPFDISTPLMIMIVCWVTAFLAAAKRYA